MSRFLRSPLLVASLFAIAIAFFATSAVAQTPTPEPGPVISFTKVGSNDPTSDVVEFTLTATNLAPNPTGDNSQTVSEQIILDDPLPAGTVWFLASTEGFTCDPLVIPYHLHCVATGLRGRHLNDTKTDFVYDAARVTVRGIRLTCGPVSNTAILTGDDFEGAKRASAVAYGIPCATPVPPTPTATPPPPTPTSTAIAATPTPVVIIVEVTPTARPSTVPAPPKTGNTQTDQPVDQTLSYVLSVLTGGLILCIGLAWAFKRHNNQR